MLHKLKISYFISKYVLLFIRHLLHRGNSLHQKLLHQTPTKCFRASQTKKPQELSLVLKCTGFTGIVSGGVVLKLALSEKTLCHPKNTRLVGLQRTHTGNLSFEWRQFWNYLKPHILNFLLAIAVS